jgi:hypothetical protein
MLTKEQIIGETRMSRQEKINLVEQLLISTNRPGVDKIIEFMRNTDFYTAPASAKYHSNYEGGLLDHSLMVYSIMDALYDQFIMIDPELGVTIPKESVIICSLLHDICKANFYKLLTKWKKNEYNEWVSYEGYDIEDAFPIGHGEKSVIELIHYGLELNPCEMLAIRYHMGFWGEQNAEFKIAQTSAIKMCPLVVLMQQADCSATMIFEKTIEN